MQIKLHLHLLSLWPFMPHIESGNKSLIEFMKHKSRTNPGADPVTSLVPLPASASRWLPVIWHASLSNRHVWHRASSFKGQKSDLKSISRARDDRRRHDCRVFVLVCVGKKRQITPGNTHADLLINTQPDRIASAADKTSNAAAPSSASPRQLMVVVYQIRIWMWNIWLGEVDWTWLCGGFREKLQLSWEEHEVNDVKLTRSWCELWEKDVFIFTVNDSPAVLLFSVVQPLGYETWVLP